MKKPEILAPCSTLESVTAALNAGCDAIYIGGSAFGARAYADNPSDDALCNIIKICSLRGVKVFITLNTLYKENEIQKVLDFVKKVYSYGAYGLIIQDLGMVSLIKKYYPDIKISASTQMTVHNIDAVNMLTDMGCSRIVLARELSQSEITDICSKKGNTEIEGFIHGALCVCYSGRCLMSSIIGQRSGNRGRCAQPCRMEYSLLKDNQTLKSGYLLSPKDISTAEILDRVLATGIDSLKIEGRMKSPEYVYQVVLTYRKYVDEIVNKGTLTVEKEDIANLTQIFNRGGSSSYGYYDTYSSLNMLSKSPKSSGVEIGVVTGYNPKNKRCSIKLSRPVTAGDGIEIWSKEHTGTGVNQTAGVGSTISVVVDGYIQKGDRVFKSFDKALNDILKKTYSKNTRKMTVNATASVNTGEKSYIEFPDYGIKVYGEVAEKPLNRPMTENDIVSRLSKTGDTPFIFNFKNCNIGENVYIPVSALNNLRRNACSELENKITENTQRENISAKYEPRLLTKAENTNNISVKVRTWEQFLAALETKPNRIYCEVLDEKAVTLAHKSNIELYFALPYISRDGYGKYFEKLDKYNPDGYLLRSIGKISTSKNIVTDYTFNIFNRQTVSVLDSIYNLENYTLSPELNLQELKELTSQKSEVVIYGRLPLMTTHQCPVGIHCANKKPGKYCKLKDIEGKYELKDRKNVKFPIVRDCDNCVAFILNSAPVCILNKKDDILSLNSNMLRLDFTTEDAKTVKNVICEHINVLQQNSKMSAEFEKYMKNEKATGGHFYRGVL